jgi:hypothetical protein
MTDRLEPNESGRVAARRPPADTSDEAAPTLLGFPAEFADADDGAVAEPDVAPSSAGLTVLRRADPIGAGALALAGVAANVSLLLSWSPGEGPTGLVLVKQGVEGLRFGSDEGQVGFWQPPVIVLSGGLLVLLGLLLLVPARTHRLVGVLTLIVALAAAGAVVVLMAASGLVDDRFGPGMWCAVAVPVLGLLGALKAMLTVPLVKLDRR